MALVSVSSTVGMEVSGYLAWDIIGCVFWAVIHAPHLKRRSRLTYRCMSCDSKDDATKTILR